MLIAAARISQPAHADAQSRLFVTLADRTEKLLFSFSRNESFVPADFIGLTEEQALQLQAR